MNSFNAKDPLASVILLVEDNDNDAELTRLGFAQSKLAVDLRHVSDGEQCLLFLRKVGSYANAPTPNLVLLDLHMPRMNGLEVLEAIGRDERLQHIPIVVLTTSDAPSDVQACYRLRCNSYVVKPVGFAAFAKTIQAVCNYWLGLAALPAPLSSQQHSAEPTVTLHSRTGTHS